MRVCGHYFRQLKLRGHEDFVAHLFRGEIFSLSIKKIPASEEAGYKRQPRTRFGISLMM